MREGVGAVSRVVIHNPPGDHRPQPFAHVTLVKAGARRDRFTSRGRHVCHGIEKPYPVAQRGHKTKRPRVQDADQALLESCGPRVIEWSGVRHEILRCKDKIRDISSFLKLGRPSVIGDKIGRWLQPVAIEPAAAFEDAESPDYR